VMKIASLGVAAATAWDAMRQGPASSTSNPYRKDDTALFAEVVSRRKRRAQASALPASLTRFALGTGTAGSGAAAEKNVAIHDNFFEGAAMAAMQRLRAANVNPEDQGSQGSRSRSVSPGGSAGASREPSPEAAEAAEELAARTATVRPKRAAKPPPPPSAPKPASPPVAAASNSRIAKLEGFLAAASAAAPVREARQRSPSPQVPDEKKAILNGFLAAMGLAGPPPSRREASDAVYEGTGAIPWEESTTAEDASPSAAPGEGGAENKPRFAPMAFGQPNGRAAKVAAASAVASALSNISGAAAAARAASEAFLHAAANKDSAEADSFVKASTAKDKYDPESRRERSSSARKDRDRDRSDSRRKRRRSESGSRERRRKRSRSRSGGRSRSRKRSRSRSRRRRGFEDDTSVSLVTSSELQAAEQLAMARRMTTIVGTPGEARLRPGDWNCPVCQAHNFASKFQCFRCAKAKNPFLETVVNQPHMHAAMGCGGCGMSMGVGPSPQTMKVGDWLCARCSAHNFASKFQCFRCSQGKNPMLSDQAVQGLHLPMQAQIGGRSAAGLALKAAAMAGRGAGQWSAQAAMQAQAAGFAISATAAGATPGFSATPAGAAPGFSSKPPAFMAPASTML